MFFTRKQSITPDQAAAGLANRELVLVDVRQALEIHRYGVAPSSARNPTSLSSFLGRPDGDVRPVRLSLGLAAG